MLAWSDHGEELVKFLNVNLQRHSDTILSVQGENIPVNNMVLASASPFLARLVSTTHDKIIIDGISIPQVRQLVEFMYKGTIDRVAESDFENLITTARELQIMGILSSVKLPIEEEEEVIDDVFVDDVVEQASADTKVNSSNQIRVGKRFDSLNKISEALTRSSMETETKSSDRRETLARIKKPKPLTELSGEEMTGLKLKTPKTPLLVSPDGRALEERFRDLISSCTPEQQENLRNLSVSSADFNFDIGSLPGTPVNTSRSFNIQDQVKQEKESSLDLSFNRRESNSDHRIPTINIVKPEPVDHDSLSIAEEEIEVGHLHKNFSVKSEKGSEEDAQASRGSFFFPNLNLPLVLPYPQYMFNRMEHHEPTLARDFKSSFSSNPHSAFTPTKPDELSKAQLIEASKPKQVYKCEKCGKCYNWNYNLNRHMRFECGIENKFECAICKKRFPYKQNAAIHLKRKHKVVLETADDMLNTGQIIHLSAIPKTSS